MELAKVTSKGQVTIPIEIRKKLGIKNGDKEAWRALLPGKCKLDDVIELRKRIAEAKPLEGRTGPFVLRGCNN